MGLPSPVDDRKARTSCSVNVLLTEKRDLRSEAHGNGKGRRGREHESEVFPSVTAAAAGCLRCCLTRCLRPLHSHPSDSVFLELPVCFTAPGAASQGFEDRPRIAPTAGRLVAVNSGARTTAQRLQLDCNEMIARFMVQKPAAPSPSTGKQERRQYSPRWVSRHRQSNAAAGSVEPCSRF